MRKWFNTNYHCMVPVLDEKTRIKLNGSKPFEEYSEALALETVPAITGPFTLLKLSDIRGNVRREDFIIDLLCAYSQILEKFNSLECRWFQLDEPSLVTDLDLRDKELFLRLYTGSY
jgi:5-methyltetrahydropteroyltriglutamate--homocysteine methyltransferase